MTDKIIVTHISPDLDAISSVWLIKKYLPDWEEAVVRFVPSGTTLDHAAIDSDEDIIHVDTGFGRFDHHQSKADTCAAELVFKHLKKNKLIKPKAVAPLRRIVAYVCDIDHFKEIYYPEPDADIYDFQLNNLIDGLKNNLGNDSQLVTLGQQLLEAVLIVFTKKVSAEEELNQGYIFESSWGKTLLIESDNSDVSRLAQKKGYDLTVQKYAHNGSVRIKLRPDNKHDLKKIYETVLKKDPDATWFYHVSGKMLLNGSATNPQYIASKLTIRSLLKIIRDL